MQRKLTAWIVTAVVVILCVAGLAWWQARLQHEMETMRYDPPGLVTADPVPENAVAGPIVVSIGSFECPDTELRFSEFPDLLRERLTSESSGKVMFIYRKPN